MTATISLFCRCATYVVAFGIAVRAMIAPTAADIITFSYSNQNAVIASGFDLDNFLGLGVGPLDGKVVQASMTLRLDRGTTPTFSDPTQSYCNAGNSGIDCGLSGTASIGGYVVNITPVRSNNYVLIANSGNLGQETALIDASTGDVTTPSDPLRIVRFGFASQSVTGELLTLPLLSAFDFAFLSFTQIMLSDTTRFTDLSQNNETCGEQICGGFSAQILLSRGDPNVSLTVTEVPEANSIALIGMALLSLFGFSLLRRRQAH